MAKERGILRSFPAGAVVSGVGISIKRESDDVELATDTTDGEGVWDYIANLSPGPRRWEGTDTAATPDNVRVGSTNAYGSGGAYSLYELPIILRALGNGVVDGYLNELAVTYDAAGLDLDIATGAAVVKGIPAVVHTSAEHTVATARDATHPKSCYLVLEVTGLGEAAEGKVEFKDTCGAAAASPSLPALTQTEAAYQYPLATFTLPNSGSTTLTNLADVRTFVLTRNPVVTGVARRTDPTSVASTISTTGVDLLTVSPTLVSGVVYDLYAHAFAAVKATAGQTVSIAVYLNGTSNISDYIATNVSADYVGLGNSHVLAGVTGAGAASCGVRWKCSGGTASAITGYLLIVCVPRT